MDNVLVAASTGNSVCDLCMSELVAQAYKAKITSPAVATRPIRLLARALLLDLQDHAGSAESKQKYRTAIQEIASCENLTTLLSMLLKLPLPEQAKEQFLKQASKSMGYAINDASIWHLIITLQVSVICDTLPCDDFIALKHYVPDLLHHYKIWMGDPTYKLLLYAAIQKGRWNLEAFESVRQYRAEVQAAAPDIPWDKLFDPSKKLSPRKFHSFPELVSVCEPLVENIHRLAALSKKLPKDDREPYAPLVLLSGTLMTLIRKSDGKISRKLLSFLTKPQSGSVPVALDISKVLSPLNSLQITDDKLREARDRTYQSLNELIDIVQRNEFTDRFSRCDEFTLEMLDKEAESSLILGNAVSCCLATDGTSFDPEMINRLTHPSWVPVVIRDHKQNYVAVAWTVIAIDEATKQVMLVEDFADLAPRFSQTEVVNGTEIENRLGNQLMKALHAYVNSLAVHLGVQGLVGAQARGRMERFEAFAKRPEDYFSKPGLRILCNESSTGDNIQHPGVLGRFFYLTQ